jgi:hypothetical protein
MQQDTFSTDASRQELSKEAVKLIDTTNLAKKENASSTFQVAMMGITDQLFNITLSRSRFNLEGKLEGQESVYSGHTTLHLNLRLNNTETYFTSIHSVTLSFSKRVKISRL